MENVYPQDLMEVVEETLTNDPVTRNSDIELYKAVLMKFYGTTDIAQISLKGDIFNSLKRCRQKVQQFNPFLQPTVKTSNNRRNLQKVYEDFGRKHV